MNLTDIIDRITELPEWLTLLLVGFGAGLEYLFPPSPGDTITVAASILATHTGAAWWWVLVASSVGSILGSVIAWYIGHWFLRSGRLARMRPSQRKALDAILTAFEKHGPIWLSINRFIPGLRSLVFIAAAMAGIPLRVSTFWSAISAVTWSGMLVGIGIVLANNFDAIEKALQRVQLLGVFFVVIIAFFALRYAYRARRRALALRAAGIDDES